MKITRNATVKVKGEKPGSIDEYARINSITSDGYIWVVNLNMPYMGTISEVISPEIFHQKYDIV